nr:MAG TPA: hypothetical protein [Caudoviricetes sp.]
MPVLQFLNSYTLIYLVLVIFWRQIYLNNLSNKRI